MVEMDRYTENAERTEATDAAVQAERQGAATDNIAAAQVSPAESANVESSGVAAALQEGKMFYTIGEVAAMFNVNTSLIRFWDKEFEVISPSRNRKGNRLFTPTDVAHFHKIYHWVKEEGYTLQGAKDKLKEKPMQADAAKDELLQRLHKIRKFLVDLKEDM